MKTAGWRDHLSLLGGRRFSGDMPTEIRVALATEENFLQHSVPLSFLSAASRAFCPEIVSSRFPSGREVEESLFTPAAHAKRSHPAGRPGSPTRAALAGVGADSPRDLLFAFWGAPPSCGELTMGRF